MNIFALDKDPEKAARYHVDKHTVKMILEYCQIMSTTHRVLDGVLTVGKTAKGRKKTFYKLDNTEVDTLLYKATHVNHPSTVWTRADSKHYNWLGDLLAALCKEYTHRYGKVHKAERTGLVEFLRFNTPRNISDRAVFTLPTPAMPDTCKVPGDVVASYRNYYVVEKQRMFSWKKREKPLWIDNMIKNSLSSVVDTV